MDFNLTNMQNDKIIKTVNQNSAHPTIPALGITDTGSIDKITVENKKLQIKNDRARLNYIARKLKAHSNMPTTNLLDVHHWKQWAKDLLDISSRMGS